MSNTAIMNPVAQVASMNRPVLKKDIANALGLPLGTVCAYLSKKAPAKNLPGSKVELVRRTAAEMGYDPNAALLWHYGQNNAQRKSSLLECSCVVCGKTFQKTGTFQKYCPECAVAQKKMYQKKYHGRSMNYHNGNFKTRDEEIARMNELRTQGYSNSEIAKAIGRSDRCVLANIGKQDPELSKQNIAMAAHIRAQKNAARKQYIINKPIREYNKRVEQHNKMKEEIAKIEAELRPQTPAIEKAAQIKIDFPLVNLATVQPTALQ